MATTKKATTNEVTDPLDAEQANAESQLRQETQSTPKNGPTLELRRNKKRLARLAQVKLRAAQRTNRRIQLINEDLAEQEENKKAGR